MRSSILFVVMLLLAALSVATAQELNSLFDNNPSAPVKPQTKANPGNLWVAEPANTVPSLTLTPGTSMRMRKKAMVQLQQVYESIPEEEQRQIREWKTLAEKIKKAPDSEKRVALGNDLRKLLEDLFDADLARRDNELKELEARVKKLRDGVERRRTNRDRIINVQVDSVMLDAEGLSFFDRNDFTPAIAPATAKMPIVDLPDNRHLPQPVISN